MKRILFQAAFMLLSTTVSAQDVIVKKNGEEIRAKVEEVGEQSIRYRKFTNLTGPVYSIARGEVFVIRYESGAKDIITPLDRSAAAGKTQDTGIAARRSRRCGRPSPGPKGANATNCGRSVCAPARV